jgi:ABC-2 type transport system ATP-binding protein
MSGDHSSSDTVGSAGRDPPAISADGITKVYDGPEGELRAVDDVSFTVDSGTVVGVLGPNGAGKTTLIKSILGLVIPTSGTAEIDGIDVHDNPNEAYERAGAMLEGARNIYWRLTVRENLEFFASLVGYSPSAVRERHDELLDRFDLREKADEPVKELSRGMKQKVSLASTLSRGGSVLFLDEPTLGLDVESSVELRRELRDLVTGESMTVVLSSHDMDVIEELCDRVIIMNDGRIIADDTVENLTGVFSSQAYEVTMNGTLPERSRQTIEREHAVERWEQTADGATQFEVVLEDGAALYDLVGTLEASGIAVASLDAIQPDLESAFLEITNDDRASRAGDEETAGDSTADTESEVSAPMPEPDGGLGADDSGQETGGDRS